MEDVLKIDLLCGLAWFNLGVAYSKAGKSTEAVFSFAMCGLIHKGDVEAWVNATILAFNKEVPILLMPLIIRVAYYYNGDQYLSQLYKSIKELLGEKALNQISVVFENVIPKKYCQEDKPVLRVLGDDGIFRNVFDKVE